MLLNERLKSYTLILGSRSPRRRQLLDACGLEHVVCDYQVEETYPAGMPANDVPLHIAGLKSDGFPRRLAAREVLVTADTIVVCGDTIMGKPRCAEEAVRMLRTLSGRRHTVVTGVVIRDARRRDAFIATTHVWFRELSDEEIAWYVETFNPLDKAGAYGIQEWIGYAAVSRIEGSFYNVMGLPVQALYVQLERFLAADRQ